MKKPIFIIECLKATFSPIKPSLFFVCKRGNELRALPLHRFRKSLGLIRLDKVITDLSLTDVSPRFYIDNKSIKNIEKYKGMLVMHKNNGSFIPYHLIKKG